MIYDLGYKNAFAFANQVCVLFNFAEKHTQLCTALAFRKNVNLGHTHWFSGQCSNNRIYETNVTESDQGRKTAFSFL